MTSRLSAAIKHFEDIKAQRIKWYKERGRVSMVQMVEQEQFIKSCDWAITELREQVNFEHKD